MRRYLVLGLLVIASIVLAACSASQPTTAASGALSGGSYTPLGGVQKNDHPTASDFADLQAAENGTLGRPVFVEFYADY